MKILLAGGGSGGSVSPLLAVAAAIKKEHTKAQFLFVGGTKGPEREMAENAGIKFTAISAGKFRRYFSIQNFLSPFLITKGFFQARRILKSFQPDAVFGTGSFIQVPVAWAAYFAGVPVVLHQQDVVPSLANKLCQMVAVKITVTFEKSLTDFEFGSGVFYKKFSERVVLTGNPFNQNLKKVSMEEGKKFFGLADDFPTVLFLGGGTGAKSLNRAVHEALPQLKKFAQILHITGKGKKLEDRSENYLPLEFTKNMGEAYAAADIVVSRCGLSTLTELSNLKKLAILVPLPDSHQEFNAWVMDKVRAAAVLEQKDLNPDRLARLIKKILFDYSLQTTLKENMAKIMPKNADDKIAKIIIKLVQKNEGN